MADNRAKGEGGVLKAAGILVIANFLSSILGYIREIIISSSFGLGPTTDSYYAAFTIPDLVYTLLVGGGLSAAFIPVFSAYMAEKKYDEGYRMASSILNLTAIFAAFICILGIIFAPKYMRLVIDFSSWPPEYFDLTIKLTRIMFLQCFFMCLTGICMGILQSVKKFTPPSVGAVLYNITIISVGTLLLTLGFGITGFSIGVVAGSIVNLMVQVIPIQKMGFKYEPKIDFSNNGVRKFFKMFGPVLIGVSVTQLNQIVNRRFGSSQGESVLSAMKNAQSLMQLPINIFAYAIAMSIFPTMVEHYSKGRKNSYKKDLSMGIRNVVFITLPSSVGLIALRTPLIRALYYQGRFTEENVQMLATLLMFYSIGIVGYSVRQVVSQGFYSIQETKTPVTINMFILLLNMGLSALFVRFWGANGLALAYSTAGLVSMTLQIFFLRKKVGRIRGREIISSVLKSAAACLAMFIVITVSIAIIEKVMPINTKIYQFVEVAILLMLGVSTYVITALLLKMKELEAIINIIKRKLHR